MPQALTVPAVIAAVIAAVILVYRLGTRRGAARFWELLQNKGQEVDDVQHQLQIKSQHLEEMRLNANLEAKKAREYFAIIDGVVNEAQELRRLYQLMCAQHGNAQGIMMTGISNLGRQYLQLVDEYQRATGKKPSRPTPVIDPIIHRVAREFEDEHTNRQVETPNADGAKDRIAD